MRHTHRSHVTFQNFRLHASSFHSLLAAGWRGKVRDNYAVGSDRILMVASDRSVHSMIMGEPIPGRRVADADGAVLVRQAQRALCRTTSPAMRPKAWSPDEAG